MHLFELHVRSEGTSLGSVIVTDGATMKTAVNDVNGVKCYLKPSTRSAPLYPGWLSLTLLPDDAPIYHHFQYYYKQQNRQCPF